MWSVGGDFGEEHNARREMSHQFSNRGYVRSQGSLPLSAEDEAYVQEQIDRRTEAKRDRDFRTADGIREDLQREFDVSINDKMKLWSVGGVFEEENGGGRDRPGRQRGVYTRRGGGDLSDEAVEEIEGLLKERYECKKFRDYDRADEIRADLQNRFDVKIDDRSGEWRIDTDEYFPSSTGDLTEENISHVTEKLRERFQYKRDRDYDAADAIRDELREQYGVSVDDRTKEWKVEAVEEPQHTVAYTNDDDDDADDDESNEDLEATSADQWDDEDEEEEDIDDSDIVSEAEEEDEVDNDGGDDSEGALLSEEELAKLTIPVLKEKLRDAGLPVSGKKADLVARLVS